MKKILTSICVALIASFIIVEITSCKEVVEEHVHDIVEVKEKDATCTEDGNIAYYKCSSCDKFFSDSKGEKEIDKNSVVIASKGHSLVKTEAIDSTCESSGNIEYYKCSVCGKLFSDAEGKNEISEADIVLAALGHNIVKVEAIAVTEEKAGNIEYYKCSVCNKLFSDAEGKNEISADAVIIPATGHKLDKVNAVVASCESAGNIEYYKCSVCNKLFSDAEGKNEISEADIIIAALGHSIVKVDAVEATCESDGNIEYYKCSICGKLFSDAEGKSEISADDVIIPASHKLDKVDAVEATCQNPGNIAHFKCSVCGKLFSDAEGKSEISEDEVNLVQLDHQFSSAVIKKEPTEDSEGSLSAKCIICNNEIEIILPILSDLAVSDGTYLLSEFYKLEDNSFARYGKYKYVLLGTEQEFVFEASLGSEISSMAGRNDLSIDLSSLPANQTFARNTLQYNRTINSARYGALIKNTTPGKYKLIINSSGSDIVATLISTDGESIDLISSNVTEAIFEIKDGVDYMLVFISNIRQNVDIEYSIEASETPKISLTENYVIANIAGGNVYAGEAGGSVVVQIADDVVAGDYIIELSGNNLLGRNYDFTFAVNDGEEISGKLIMRPLSIQANVTVKPGDTITITSKNLVDMSSITVSLKTA